MPEFITEKITSRQNQLVTRIAKLSDKKHRDAENLFRIDGIKLFLEAVKSSIDIEYVFISESVSDRLLSELSNQLSSISGAVIVVSDSVFSKLTDEKAPQGIVAAARKFKVEPETSPISENYRALLLSSIRDPGNLGTIIRTAYAIGVDRVYMSKDCADIYSPKVIRAAMGTIFRQKLTVTSDEFGLVKRLSEEGCMVLAAAMSDDAMKLGSLKFPDKVCIAVGNEGHGLSEDLIAACAGKVIIPMNPECESLNAAGAAAILIYEMCRERLIGGNN
jgi:TrmH family RNA methyltransferase